MRFPEGVSKMAQYVKGDNMNWVRKPLIDRSGGGAYGTGQMVGVSDPQTAAEIDALDREYAQYMAEQNAADERAFIEANNNLARVMGRPLPFAGGLTSGPASTRGQAGQPAPYSPAGFKPARAMGNTYFGSNGTGDNRIELAGMMNRGIQKLMAGDKSGIQEFLKGYNDGPWSSRTDATDLEIDDNGGITLYATDTRGNRVKINDTPVPAESLQNVIGNQFTGQNVFQRSGVPGGIPGSSTQSAAGLGTRSSQFWAENQAKVIADQIKALQDPTSAEYGQFENDADRKAAVDALRQQQQDIITSGAGLINQAEVGSRVRKSAGKSGAGLQTPMINPSDIDQFIRHEISNGRGRDEILQAIWQMTADPGIMARAEAALVEDNTPEPASAPGGLNAVPSHNTAALMGLTTQQAPAGLSARPQPTQPIAPVSRGAGGMSYGQQVQPAAHQPVQTQRRGLGYNAIMPGLQYGNEDVTYGELKRWLGDGPTRVRFGLAPTAEQRALAMQIVNDPDRDTKYPAEIIKNALEVSKAATAKPKTRSRRRQQQ